MKNKKRLVAFLFCSCLLLCGCEKKEYAEDIIIKGGTVFSEDNSRIKIDIKYTLQGYEKKYTETGCVVTIYYELKEMNKND